MFCSKCGRPVGAQPYCPGCGAPTGLADVPPQTVPVMPQAGFPVRLPFAFSRIARHVRTLGILWIAFAIYTMITWLLVLPLLHMAFGGGSWMGNSMRGSEIWIYGFHPGGWLLHFITVVVFARAFLSLAVGIALLTRQPWGRVFAIVIAVLTLIKPILGTLLAIYTLWVLLERDAGDNYAELAARQEAFPPPPGPAF